MRASSPGDTAMREVAPADMERCRRIVLNMDGRHPGAFDDMFSDALLGLWRATLRYDPARGAFWTYAHPKVVGAIVDGLRARDHLTRSHRRHINRGDIGYEDLGPASHLDAMGADDGSLSMWHELGVGGFVEDRVAHDMTLDAAVTAIDGREGVVLRWWLDGIHGIESAEALGVSESRISQLLRQGLDELREELGVTHPEDLLAA